MGSAQAHTSMLAFSGLPGSTSLPHPAAEAGAEEKVLMEGLQALANEPFVCPWSSAWFCSQARQPSSQGAELCMGAWRGGPESALPEPGRRHVGGRSLENGPGCRSGFLFPLMTSSQPSTPNSFSPLPRRAYKMARFGAGLASDAQGAVRPSSAAQSHAAAWLRCAAAPGASRHGLVLHTQQHAGLGPHPTRGPPWCWGPQATCDCFALMAAQPISGLQHLTESPKPELLGYI